MPRSIILIVLRVQNMPECTYVQYTQVHTLLEIFIYVVSTSAKQV